MSSEEKNKEKSETPKKETPWKPKKSVMVKIQETVDKDRKAQDNKAQKK
jgi:hypothetical protein